MALRLLLAASLLSACVPDPARRSSARPSDPPLILAALLGDPSRVAKLLDKGADVDAKDARGRTALMAAASAGRLEVVDLLLARGASILLRDAAGRTALAQASPPTAGRLEAAERRLAEPHVAAAERARAGGRVEAALGAYASALGSLTRGSSHARELRAAALEAARSLPQPPALPEAARRHVVRSRYLAQEGAPRAQVEAELQAALDAAPWWAEGYYNLGLLEAEQGRYRDAIASLRLFASASPQSPEAQAVQDKVYELEAAQEQADKVAGLAGSWTLEGQRSPTYTVRLEGSKLKATGDGFVFTVSLDGERLEGTVQSGPQAGDWSCTIPGQLHPVTGYLAADGRSLQFDFVWSAYQAHGHCVNMAGIPSNCCLLCEKVCDGVNVLSSANAQIRLVR